MIDITATVPVTEAPAWAVLQRQLFTLMEASVDPFLAKYTHPDGRLIYKEEVRNSRDGADDFYESFYNWPLLYLLGGDDRLLDLGKHQWDATTRLLEDLGHLYKEYEIGYDQFHQSESYIYFYLLCMADPFDPALAERARRFAGFYLNEDPEAPNYDSEKRIIRCVHSGSRGPRWLYQEDEVPSYGYAEGMKVYGLPFEDVEGVETFDDLKDPEKARRMGEAMKERTAEGDAACNLSVCSLIANAYLLTGEAKYRDWLVEYVGAWRERAEQNGGLVPDNVGLSGAVGEYLGGRWYGSRYGWGWPHGAHNVVPASIIAGVSTYLATGDTEWLEFPRSQIRALSALGKYADISSLTMSLRHHWTGQLAALPPGRETWVIPYRYSDNGWFDYQPLAPNFSATLWNAAGMEEDRQLLEDLRGKEGYDWRTVTSFRTKQDDGHEQPWLAFIAGDNPGYPEQILNAALQQVYRRLEQIRTDESDLETVHIHHWQRLNPVTTEALIQTTLGAPQMPYNGGILLAPVRYFDAERRRPGLPTDVAALVESVTDDSVTVHLVNLDGISSARVIVQAGTLGEHRFTSATYNTRSGDWPGEIGSYAADDITERQESSEVNNHLISVELPPGTQISIELGLDRSVRPASYAFPWDAAEHRSTT